MYLPVAIFTDKFGEYQRTFVESISHRLNQNGLGTVCFAGRELGDYIDEDKLDIAANSIYTLIDEHNVSGVIFLSGTLGHAVSHQRLASFVNQFVVPKVSLGLHLPDIASVVVDDNSGMQALMEHLLDDPKRRNFAFIRGYSTDPFSTAREEIFRSTLTGYKNSEKKIKYIDGNYDDALVFHSVSKLLVDDPAIDTLVAANDLMALSAVRAVVASGRSVPADIVVTGFDDTFDSIRSYPAITTVRQPLANMGRIAANLMLQQIFDGESSELLEVKSTLVVRESSSSHSLSSCDSIHDKKTLLKLFSDAMAGLEPPDNVSVAEICDHLLSTATNQDSALLRYCSAHLTESMSVRNLQWWLNLCSQIELQCVPLFDEVVASDSAKTAILVQLGQIRQQLWGVSSGNEIDSRRIQAIKSNFQLLLASLTESQSVETIIRQLIAELDISDFFMVVFPTPDTKTTITARLLIEYSDGEFKLDSDNSEFPSRDLLPGELASSLHKDKWLLSPIYAAHLILGYIISDISSENTTITEDISLTIGSVLHNSLLMQELDGKKSALQLANLELRAMANTDSLTGLSNRFRFNADLESVFDSFQGGSCWASLLFIDLDGFKSINDSLGHSAGDDLLKILADRMKSYVKSIRFSKITVYRLGGDEFTAIIQVSRSEHTVETHTQVQKFASLLLESIAMPVPLGRVDANISASIGIARLTDSVRSEGDWLKSADKAMYEAKISGKNQISTFNSDRLFPDEAA